MVQLSHDAIATIIAVVGGMLGWVIKRTLAHIHDILHRLKLHTMVLYAMYHKQDLPEEWVKELNERAANGEPK